jgi:hypothetical protein
MNEQPTLFTAARLTDPNTSQVNRDAFYKKASQRDQLLWTYYAHTGLTDEEAGMNTRWKDSNMYLHRLCYWKRCSELRKLELIAPTGQTRISAQGQQQQVCEITTLGEAFINDMNNSGLV